jgi:hypothetical protein
MRASIGITTGLIVRLAAAVAGTTAIAVHESRAAAAYTGETGRPSSLINRPACGTDSAPEDWLNCWQWPQSGNRSLHRPGP